MATSTGFKQQCPSCEAMVPIKDPKLIGKKIDCPKCKYRFVVEEPAAEDTEAEEGAAAEKTAAKKGKAPAKGAENGKAAAAKKGAKKKKQEAAGNNKMVLGLALAGVGVVVLGVAAYFMFFRGGNKSPTTTSPSGSSGNTQANASNAGQQGAAPNPEGEQKPAPKSTAKTKGSTGMSRIAVDISNLLLPGTDQVATIHFKDILDSDLGEVLLSKVPNAYVQARLGFPLRNVDEVIRTQSDKESWAFNVVHLTEPVNLKDVQDALGAGDETKKTVKNYDYYLATKDNPWLDQLGRLTLTKKGWASRAEPRRGPVAVHQYNENTLVFADEVAMERFLLADRQPPKAKSVKRPPPKPKEKKGSGPGERGGAGFRMPSPTGPMGPAGPQGGPQTPRGAPPGGYRGMMGPRPGQAGGPPSGGGEPAAEEKKGEPELDLSDEPYLTIPESLRDMLLRLDKEDPNDPGRVLAVSAALTGGSPTHQFWDISTWFAKEPADVEVVGASLLMKDDKSYKYQSGLLCKTKDNARTLTTELEDDVGPSFAKFFSDVTGIDLKVAKEKEDEEDKDNPPTGGGFRPPFGPDSPIGKGGGMRNMGPRGYGGAMGPRPGPGGGSGSSGYGPSGGYGRSMGPAGPTGGPGGGRPSYGPGGGGSDSRGGEGGEGEEGTKREEEKYATGIAVTQEDNFVRFTLKLVLEDKDKESLRKVSSLVFQGLRGELDLELLGGPVLRHRLAAAVGNLPGADLGDRKKPGAFPQAALARRPSASRSGHPWEPDKRISWMATVLPYLGHDSLYNNIQWEHSWDDKENLVAARTLVPEFLDPSYPVQTRYANYPGTPVGVAATHYVAIAGIGEDAADEPDQSPDAAKRLGVFGYDRQTAASALERGAAHTAVVIQVPPTYGTPWMAGGGSTVRGIPETRSIDPFVSVKNKDGQMGTYVLMADGSVRFVSAKISDEAFKAMCRTRGQAEMRDDDWQLVPAPRGAEVRSGAKK